MISKSSKEVLQVGKKRVIAKVSTFKDMMLTSATDQVKKEKVLELLKEKEDVLTNKAFGFNLDDVSWLSHKDPRFFLDLVSTLKSKMVYNRSIFNQCLVHVEKVLKTFETEDKRTILRTFKTFLAQISISKPQRL